MASIGVSGRILSPAFIALAVVSLLLLNSAVAQSALRRMPLPYSTGALLWRATVFAAPQTAISGPSLLGTWAGTFSSKNFPSFTVSIAITQNSAGRAIGAATLSSQCMANANLAIAVSGSSVVLAGSDSAGDNITFRGSIASNGSQLVLSYILNASASGKCETDQGSGTLALH